MLDLMNNAREALFLMNTHCVALYWQIFEFKILGEFSILQPGVSLIHILILIQLDEYPLMSLYTALNFHKL